MHGFSSLIASLALTLPVIGQTWEREAINFEAIQSRARDLANKPYTPPPADILPAWITNLSYDQYRDIRFNPNQALWAADELPFRAMFFHPGGQHKNTVTLNEFSGSHQQQIRLAESYFNYGPLISNHGDVPSSGGFSGFRIHHPLNNPGVFDELISFQDASYWRALGKNQHYGLSARGIAVNTGVDGKTEEFPAFREFWLAKPEKNDTQLLIYALLDGPSYAAAYEFKVNPANDTQVNVKVVIFTRAAVQRFGIAPMSSMFWFGENSRRRFDDFRPEVHDSDGLAIRTNTGERIWRPLSNDSDKPVLSFFNMEKCEGFGLLQRDRNFTSYEDNEAEYHKRPGLWIEPTSDWGRGRVMLLEIPTDREFTDNVVAMYEPEKTPQPGDRLEFSYRQSWTMGKDPSQAGGYSVATRTGLHDWNPNERTITIDFEGGNLTQESEIPLTAQVEATGTSADKIKILAVNVQELPDKRRRVSFQITPATADAKLSEVGPVELRCCLKRGDNYLTETWVHRVIP